MVKPELELTGYVDFLKELRKVGTAQLGFQNNRHPHCAGGSEARGAKGWNFPKVEARNIPNCGLTTDASLLSLVLPVSKQLQPRPFQDVTAGTAPVLCELLALFPPVLQRSCNTGLN